MTQAATDPRQSAEGSEFVDVILIGAGITGVYQHYLLRKLGLNVRVLEAGDGVGGVWQWNRYPNARFDSESYTYAYLHDEELFQDWNWSEHFAGQPEIEAYLNHAVDRFELRDDYVFNSRVSAATFDDDANTWRVETEAGDVHHSRFVIAALGCLSAPIFPQAPGLEDFQGTAHHTGQWPKEPVNFTGKRVAVLGTGSSGVQVIPTIAAEAAELTIFQRTPNWCSPLNNSPITPEQQAALKADGASGTRARVQDTYGGFLHGPIMKSAHEVSEEERLEVFEMVYNAPGLIKMVGNFWDIAVDPAANKLMCDFVADKIRGRVNDPELAAKLIPDDHGFAAKRPPMENGYYEVFNQDNVRLVDVRETPLEAFTATGLKTSAEEFEFDIIVLATGFDFATGSYTRIDFTGVDGVKLAEHWADGPRTHMGLFSNGFPNLFLVGGPHSTYGNMPRSTEILADITTDMIKHAIRTGSTRIETDKRAEDDWTQHVYDGAAPTLIAQGDSFFTGTNVPGKAHRFLAYVGSTLPSFRETLDEAAGKNYEHLNFS